MADSLQTLEGLAETIPAWKRDTVLKRARLNAEQMHELGAGSSEGPTDQ